MSRVMLLGDGEGERVETPGIPTTQPDGAAGTIRIALSELIRLDRYERRAATRRARALHILLDRQKDRTT